MKTLIAAVMLLLAGSGPNPSYQASRPTGDDFMARETCVRESINRMIADPKEKTSSTYDIAQISVGRCSGALWRKIVSSASSLNRGVDMMMFDQLAENQSATAAATEERERLRSPRP
jgi:hypothetical protein